MTHEDEYHNNMVTMLELIWGEGYMAPGGPGNVARMLDGFDTYGKRIYAGILPRSSPSLD
jgi:phosphoethanolamine N-methyltransferase